MKSKLSKKEFLTQVKKIYLYRINKIKNKKEIDYLD